jgi:hypothetical protein
MLVGVHNGVVDHRVFVVGVCGEMLNIRSQTPLLAQRLNGHPDRALAPGQQIFDPLPPVATQSEPPHRSASQQADRL